MRDKRRNQATLRGLMDIMTGQGGHGDTNSVNGYDSSASSTVGPYSVGNGIGSNGQSCGDDGMVRWGLNICYNLILIEIDSS